MLQQLFRAMLGLLCREDEFGTSSAGNKHVWTSRGSNWSVLLILQSVLIKKTLNFDLFKVVSNESSKFFFRTDERYSSISVSNILIHKKKEANRQFGLISLDPDNE